MSGQRISRRRFLAAGGALVVAFSLRAGFAGAADARRAPVLPGSLKNEPMLDAWIRIDANGAVTLFTGKVEIGQGLKTALIQVAAEELIVDPRRIELVTADTSRTPDEAYTAGSQSMQDSGTAILNASAQVRAILLRLASERLAVPAEQLTIKDGIVDGGGRSVSYGALVAGRALHVEAQPQSTLSNPAARAVMGKSLPRIDIPPKVTGEAIYVQDLRLPGMVHARVARPPSYGARLRTLDTGRILKMPGVLKIVRDGSFVAVVAEREYQAVLAARALAQAATWSEGAILPPQSDLYAFIQRQPAQHSVISGRDTPPTFGAGAITATYRRPYQMHGSIGPSCAVALAKDGRVTVWTHSQGVYPLREAIAEMLRVKKESVRCIHMEGSGCYGHNGADDAGADAALIATAFTGRPVRVHWMREEEHAWEPYGSAMVSAAKGRLDAQGRVADFEYEVWSNTHSTRPAPAGNLASARILQMPFEQPPPKGIPQPAGGGDRNAVPLYRFANTRIVHHFVPHMPLRVSALRALGAYMNVFAIESFMDELAQAARADPVDFRLRHLEDPRARDALSMAAERFGWSRHGSRPGRGRGIAFARYKNLAAYTAVACEVEVERETGHVRVVRAVAANDSGEAVNPDGIRNQIEGGIIQSISWTLYEAVAFDTTRIRSRDWSTYPILRFSNVPEAVDVHIINRPGSPFLGTGEAAQGPTAAAIANAVADAIGGRIRELPLSRGRVKSAVGV